MTSGQGLAQQTIASLMPSRREIVYEILRDEIHADVSDWANYKKGATAPAANPKYCYEWSFTQDDRIVVLNLWHASFKPRGDDVICELNMRAHAHEIARAQDEPWRDKKPKPIWEKRALKMDRAIQLADRKKLPVRVIVCEGNMRDAAAGDEKASEVKRRMLDLLPWTIESYDWTSGAAILRRGVVASAPRDADPSDLGTTTSTPPTPIAAQSSEPPRPLAPAHAQPVAAEASPEEARYVDQFDAALVALPERRETTGSTFLRSPDVRAAALARAGGLCQLCASPGFVTAAGKVYLETHHVIPLGEGGADALTNVVALCATDHRRAHFDADSDRLRSILLRLAKGEPVLMKPNK
ncbi:HNH endonuclease signature motif containing protein [Pseudaquabacterium rugosum]|uniref:HNH endonuclease signature motif containing protein n=1 Tax=Pseudaquabacterium rugosum TaxID=2984194 RepID=A0ABU9BC61_9BURK